jgi:hypothetical protein
MPTKRCDKKSRTVWYAASRALASGDQVVLRNLKDQLGTETYDEIAALLEPAHA